MVFLILYFLHVEMRLAEILRGLELFRLLYVETVEHPFVRGREVACRLACQPAGSHVRNLRRRDEVVHLLRYGGGDLLVVDGDGA